MKLTGPQINHLAAYYPDGADIVPARASSHSVQRLDGTGGCMVGGELSSRPSMAGAIGMTREAFLTMPYGDEPKPETINEINEYASPEVGYGREAGFQIVTSEQLITLAISDDPGCCESWGYFLTEDNTEKFIGAELRGVSITDTNRSNRRFVMATAAPEAGDDRPIESLDQGDVMFVDLETDRGILQFFAYNAHNGYYGHTASVRSKQLQHSATL
jgi:hypothetical protein